MASKRNGTLYIGVTSNLIDRVYKHKQGLYDGFTKKYKVNKLIYYEVFEDINEAITREKQLKKWNRKWKIELMLAQLAPRILRGYCGAIEGESTMGGFI